MKALIACERSQIVTMAFRNKGIETYSCDLLPAYGPKPEYHIQGDAFQIMLEKWDFIGLHCPCTYTATSGNGKYAGTSKREEGAELTRKMWELAKKNSKFTYLEQPRTIMQKYIGKYSQIIQPWQFGESESKETWLWLKNLPYLKATKINLERKSNIINLGPSKFRTEIRSKTYQGIAEAMANQWSPIIKHI